MSTEKQEQLVKTIKNSLNQANEFVKEYIRTHGVKEDNNTYSIDMIDHEIYCLAWVDGNEFKDFLLSKLKVCYGNLQFFGESGEECVNEVYAYNHNMLQIFYSLYE